MIMAFSAIIALGLLGIRLAVQSRLLLTNDAEKNRKFAKRLEYITIATFAPVSIGMVIAGAIFSELFSSFLPVGITLMATMITFLVQGESLLRTGEEAKKLGRILHVNVQVIFFAGLFAIVVIAASMIK